jgi:hypothetical protein
MTYTPAPLKALGAYWTAHGGVNLGVVGNAAHTSGYHLGRDRIYDGTGPGLGDNDYSVKLARDKAGLTNAASAIDLGKLNGSLPQLREFSIWLVAELMAKPMYRRDFREVIYSPDGVKVQRYSALDNLIHTGPGNGDASHTGHTHLSYLRDSEGRDKIAAFAGYFAVVAPPAGGGTVDQFITYAKPKVATVPTGTWIYDNEACAAAAGNIQVSPGRTMPVAGKNAAGTVILGYIDTTPTETEVRTYFAKAGSVTIKDVPVGVTDCTAAVAAAVAPLQAQVGVLQTALQQAESARVAALALADEAAAIEKDRIAAAEGARIRAI